MIEREKLPGIAITLIILVAVVAVGFTVFEEISGEDFQQRMQENNQHWDRYCEDRFGEEAQTWTGGGQGAHAGLHCENAVGTTTVHLGQIPTETWESYKRGQASTEEVTESIRPIGPMGLTKSGWTSILGPMGLILVIVFGTLVVQRSRNR